MNSWGPELNIYAAPAFLTLVLLVAETIFLAIALPETRGKGVVPSAEKQKAAGATHANGNGHTNGHMNGKSASPTGPPKPKRTVEGRLAVLKALRSLHFFFLALFSGVEFTLTFLTFDRA